MGPLSKIHGQKTTDKSSSNSWLNLYCPQDISNLLRRFYMCNGMIVRYNREDLAYIYISSTRKKLKTYFCYKAKNLYNIKHFV